MARITVPWKSMTAGALLLAGCSSPAPRVGVLREVDLGHHFAGDAPVDATFVLVNGATGDTLVYNSPRAAQRFLPASTFKIANTLIALETGVANGIDFTIAYDSLRDHRDGFWSAGWSQDHTLKSAFSNSVYWFYQEIARRVGEARMREYLRRFDYGNQDIGGGLDRFWLHGDLRISALEQVGFLKRIDTGDLGVSKRSTEVLREIMVLKDTTAYTLRGKTGTADVTATRELGWLVGSLERGSEVWYYALNMEGEEVWQRWGNPTARRDLVLAILRELGVVPQRQVGDPPRAASTPPHTGPAGWDVNFGRARSTYEGKQPTPNWSSTMKISIESHAKAPIAAVWHAWNTPADIVQWNAASPDWHTTKSTVDLREGGKFLSRMEAKDGSFGFDFEGTYTRVVPHKAIDYAMPDGRAVQVEFTERDGGVDIRTTFDAETENPPEMQREGWQAILDHFVRHVEAKG